MNGIDTIYEYAGYKLAGSISAVFAAVGLPLIVALAGIAYAFHLMAEKGSIRPVAVHAIFLIFAAWLLGGTTLPGVHTPRFAAYAGRAGDLLQKRLVRSINDHFLTEPFEWERIAARLGSARIHDPALELRLDAFLQSCARTALAGSEPAQPNLLREGALPYSSACEQRRRDLLARMQAHLQTDPRHKATLDAARAKDPTQAAVFQERYLDEIVLRSLDEPGGPVSEAGLVAASLGEYSLTDPAQSTGSLPSWAKTILGPVGLLFGDEIANVAVGGLAQLNQEIQNRYTARQKYYQVLALGPHLYGLSEMVLLGLFPVAGLFALAPGQWRVLIHFLKVFASVKLWPVGWAVLSTFNERRSTIEAFAPPDRGGGNVFLAVAGMYLLIPAIAFLVVHLASAAAALPFTPAVPPAAGAGPVGAGPVINVAARMTTR